MASRDDVSWPAGAPRWQAKTGKNCRCQTSTSLGNAYLQMDHFIDARDTLEVVVHNIGGVSTGRCTNRCIPSPEALSMPSASGGTCSPSQCRHQTVCGDIGPLLGALGDRQGSCVQSNLRRLCEAEFGSEFQGRRLDMVVAAEGQRELPTTYLS